MAPKAVWLLPPSGEACNAQKGKKNMQSLRQIEAHQGI